MSHPSLLWRSLCALSHSNCSTILTVCLRLRIRSLRNLCVLLFGQLVQAQSEDQLIRFNAAGFLAGTSAARPTPHNAQAPVCSITVTDTASAAE